MADLSQHTNYTGAYSGLLDNLWVTLAIAGICLVGHEIEVHIPRRHGKQGTFRRIPVRVVHAAGGAWRNWRSKRRKDRDQVEQGTVVEEKEQKKTPREKLGSRESWEFGYIFQPKAWRLNPAPPAPRWPLAWIVSSLRIKERDMPETCGIDVTLHMRFIRGSFFYVLLQACTVLPILLPVHVHYAPSDLKKSSMLRAGISSLVKDSGTRWLWIHAFLIWWVTITWTLTLLWITWGGLAYRRRENRRLERSLKHSREALSAPVMVTAPTKEGNETARPAVPRGADEPEGAKRFRTLIVENIPPDMRNEDVLRDYFDHYLERHRLRSGEITHTATWVKKQVEEKQGQIMRHVHFRPSEMFKAKPSPVPPIAIAIGDSQPMTRGDTEQTFDVVDHDSADGMMESEVDEIILVRKLGAVQSLRARRNAVLRQLEVAHVKLAKRVLKAVAAHQKKHSRPENMYTQLRPVHDMDAGLDALNGPRDEHLPTGLSREERLDRLTAALGGFVADSPEQLGESSETVWDILHALPRALLDPYQALTHLKVTSFFRDQNAPLIDYLTTKLNYLSHRLDAARDKPLSSYNPSSTAFVTFRDARTARLAHKLLESHPTRTLACRTSPAPDWTNLLWPRLSMSIYRSEFVRKWVVQVGVWVFTLLWIFPVSLLCALSSFNNIAGFFKPLRAFLSAHPKAAGAISSLAPVILVAGLTLAICPILLVIANKAETINTRLAIHNSVMERFWKFLMVNGVVFFAIGQSAIEAYLTAFQNRDFDPLPVVASAFPTAAPYFASYILLQVAIQPGFEIFRFGLPTIVYVFGTRVSIIPRQRNGRTEYPTFSHFSQVPLQLLQGAIMHLFMLLNPLVIPFALVYYGMVYVVWKRQFTYVYGRLYENNGRRTSIRVLRYGLDALALAQFVLFAFFVLNKAKGNAIATGVLFFLTLGEKLIITRALIRRHDDLDAEQADLISPPVPGAHGEEIMEIISPSSDTPPGSKENVPRASGSRLTRLRSDIVAWAEKWIFAVSHRVEPGYRRPIPFEHVLFNWLDRKLTFPDDDKDMTIVRSEVDLELQHQPDHAIHHKVAQTLVSPHHPLRPWEDIPPYPRSRGYSDQPAYTDDYDDFLWLPRDPLSTLDLDDTVEMRLSLTTSTGGSGRIGNWPPEDEYEEGDDVEVIEGEEVDQSFGTDFGPPSSFGRMSISDEAGLLSSRDNAEDRFIEPVELPEGMGSEAQGGAADIVRRGTKRLGEGWNSILRRPRAGTMQTDNSGLISMRTLPSASRPSLEDLDQVSHLRPTSASGGADLVFRRPSLVGHRPDTSTSLPLDAVRPPPLRPTTSESAHSEGGLLSPRIVHSPISGHLVSRTPSSDARPIAAATSSDAVIAFDPASPGTAPARVLHTSFQTPIPERTGSPSARILGRSASGRRPSRLLSPSATSVRDPSDGSVSGLPYTAPAVGRLGSASGSRDLLRVRSARRERSESVSAAQQALMAEVIQEERLAAQSSSHKELADRDKEQDEVLKEHAKLRRISKAIGKGALLGRAASKREPMSPLGAGGSDFLGPSGSVRSRLDRPREGSESGLPPGDSLTSRRSQMRLSGLATAVSRESLRQPMPTPASIPDEPIEERDLTDRPRQLDMGSPAPHGTETRGSSD